jgi:cytochrome c-type biogenesis protein
VYASLAPIYLAQLVGRTGVYSSDACLTARLTTFLHALLFVCGFTLAFVALGATASALGSVVSAYQFQLRQVGGFLLILMGVHLAGIFRLPLFTRSLRFTFLPDRPSYAASLLIGVIFAIGWTPCISLLLGSILSLAATAATLREGVWLLLFYSLGMGLPFLLLGLGLSHVSRLLTWLKPHLRQIEVGSGLIMILVGILMYFNLLTLLNQYTAPLIRF